MNNRDDYDEDIEYLRPNCVLQGVYLYICSYEDMRVHRYFFIHIHVI